MTSSEKYFARLDGIERRMCALIYRKGWGRTFLGRITFNAGIRRDTIEIDRIAFRRASDVLA